MWYLNSLLATIVTACLWCITAILFAGIGRIVCNQKTSSIGSITNQFIVGICTTSLIGVVYRFFSPIDWRLRCLLLLPALFGSVLIGYELMSRSKIRFDFRQVLEPFRISRSQGALKFILVLILAFFFWRTANDATSYVPVVDEYHFTSIRWAQSFPYIQGLANVEGRLGFNNSTTNLHAILICSNSSTLWFSLLNGSIYSVLFGSVVVSGYRFFQNGDKTDKLNFAGLWLIIPIIIPTFLYRDFYSIGGISPDTTVCLCMWGLAAKIISLVVSDSANLTRNLKFENVEQSKIKLNRAPSQNSALRFATSFLEKLSLKDADKKNMLISVACGTLISMKISTAFFIIPFSLIFIVYYSYHLKGFHAISGFILVISVACLPIVSWAISNIILSGWIVYPVTATYLPLDWSVPLTTGKWEHNLIRDFAMTHGSMVFSPDGKWISNWVQHISLEDHIIISIPCLVVLFFFAKIQFSSTPLNRRARLIFVATFFSFIFSFIFWFISAPAPRFFIGPVFASLIILGSLLTVKLKTDSAIKVILVSVFCMLILTVFIRTQKELQRQNGDLQQSWMSLIVMQPASSTGRYQLRRYSGESRSTKSGLKIMEVESGAWSAPLLSTTRKNPDFDALQERVLGNPQHGFRIASP